MTPPDRVPAQVAAAHRGWRITPAYRGEYATAVWRLDPPDGHARYVKVCVRGTYPTLADERDRMLWCAGRLPVPEVVEHGSDGDVEWLVTVALPGKDATRLTDTPQATVRILAEGLRAFHEVPIHDCPFDFALDAALGHCRRRVAGDGVPASKAEFHAEFEHMSPAEALEELGRTRPPSEDLVLCHGDYCFPNVLISEGRATGYLDLGELGVADRWWDLAVATWSCDWNVGPGWQDAFLGAYGIDRDEDRIAYYRLMYDLAS